MLLDEMPENLDIDLLKNLYSLTTMSPPQPTQSMQTSQGLSGLPIVRRFEGSAGSGQGLADESERSDAENEAAQAAANEAADAAANAGKGGGGGDGNNQGGDDKNEEKSKGKNQTTTTSEELTERKKDFVDLDEAQGNINPNISLADSIKDIGKDGMGFKARDGFKNERTDEEIKQDEINAKKAELDKVERENERRGGGYDGLVNSGYFELAEDLFKKQNELQASQMQAELEAQGLKGVTVSFDQEGNVTYGGPGSVGLQATLGGIGQGLGSLISTVVEGVDLMRQATPMNMALSGLTGGQFGGKMGSDILNQISKISKDVTGYNPRGNIENVQRGIKSITNNKLTEELNKVINNSYVKDIKNVANIINALR